MTLKTLVLRYAFFAVAATLVNLAMQRLVLLTGSTWMHFAAAIGVGTIIGLLVKYVLDKRWIFYDTATGVKAHGQKFTLYTTMGLVTTAIFWGMETIFWMASHTDEMRELGAIIGLAIGYVVKYNLDRRFVFTDATLNARQPA
ncbi:GtrA-like protein [Hartmannibacter diazotrophicus]|uniref:GtrA-like protein n=1 Tax=Hartmannibacter diazotrophicus TaxID=1482074 RepID=A0A2C9DCT2_9HYPH|nr:GtrA family protein [Hartmannibacter diazotrophicus]SON57980.1 GtrA-like protein [Hartmannibacter diazotrophicus]